MPPTLQLFLVVLWLSLSGSFAGLPTVLFSSNVTSLELGKSAKLTCQLESFEPGTGNYAVHFYQNEDLFSFCYYTISAPDWTGKRRTESIACSSLSNPSLGRHPVSWTFPMYEITVTPTVASTGTYYCKLFQYTPSISVDSKHLSITVTPPPNPPHFTSSKPSENQRLGTCAVGATGLDLSGQTYSVQFRSDLGPKSVNLLGEYIFRPNRFEEFQSFPVTPWTSLRHGPSTSWPNFSLLANDTGALQGHGTWWCVLAVGEQGTPDYREITSGKLHL